MHSKHGDWAVKAADAWRELKPRKLPSPETIAEQYDSILSWYQRTPWPTFEIIPTPAVDKILAEVDDMKAKGKVYRPPRVPELPETDDSDVETNQKIKTLLKRKEPGVDDPALGREGDPQCDSQEAPDVGTTTKPPPTQQQPTNAEGTDMKISEMFPSKYLKADDLNGKMSVTIANVELEKIGNEKKSVVYFKGGKLKPMVLNKPKALMIGEISGSDDSDEWPGVGIMLYEGRVPFQGKQVPAILVDHPMAKNGKKPKPETDLDDDDVPY